MGAAQMHADGRTDMTNLIKSGTSVDFIKEYGIITFSIISFFLSSWLPLFTTDILFYHCVFDEGLVRY
jgi:hypothetical protein